MFTPLSSFLAYFNPCSPCGERPQALAVLVVLERFQSMLPVRGATCPPASPRGSRQNFNPCSPCGERPLRFQVGGKWVTFQSMLPVRGATGRTDCRPRCPWNFNPCSPCGERRQNQTKYGLYFGKIAEVSDRQQQRFGMYEVKHERLERLQGHFEKFRGANGRRIF